MDIPQELMEDIINEYKEAFNILDQDGDGAIKSEDIERLLITMNQKPSAEEMKDIMLTLDPEQTGEISFIQFIKFSIMCQRTFNREATLRNVFLAFDRNGDGNLNASELFYVMKALKMNVTR